MGVKEATERNAAKFGETKCTRNKRGHSRVDAGIPDKT